MQSEIHGLPLFPSSPIFQTLKILSSTRYELLLPDAEHLQIYVWFKFDITYSLLINFRDKSNLLAHFRFDGILRLMPST